MTIRLRMTIGFMAIMLLANSVLYFITTRYINQVLVQEVQTRVRLDLNSARRVYNDRIEFTECFLRALALNKMIGEALGDGDRTRLDELMQGVRRSSKIETFILTDLEGRVVYRRANPQKSGDYVTDNPIIARALSTQGSVSGTAILSREILEKESATLADRAYFEIIPTPAAKPTEDKYRSDGMVKGAAVFVLDENGKRVGLLYGASLLNRRYEIVDSIKQEVFQDQTYEDKDIGTVTIFQGDLRISTNVRTADGSRAIGTRVSEAVYDEVLVRGGTWSARAFVVNDWYITAYEPIRDVDGHTIGILYVGLLEEPFVQPRRTIVNVFLLLIALTTVIVVSLLFLFTKQILKPITKIVGMSDKVVKGDLSARVGIRPGGEMGALCSAIDQMADAVQEREQQLKIATSRQIGQSAKLASIGRLAAGIAHEINNPLTGVLTFAHLLQQKDTMDEQSKEDITVIIRETTRVREIVQGLLNFARESKPEKEPLDMNEVLTETMKLLRSQKEFSKITVVEHLAPDLPVIHGDKNQLQQVFLNLSLNAVEAMERGGTLSIATLSENGNIQIVFQDTGCGIKKENLDDIFEPFFTTKPPTKGTGLGLSVSYGIIRRHGGSIKVESQEGEGSTFTISLPVKAPEGPNGNGEDVTKA
jgi:two-component system NtrC family sensor kinase